jgi:N-carbamoylputrescine amidase
MQNREKFTIGLIQMAMTKEPADNLSRALNFVENAAKGGAQVICLPELFRSQYFCQVENAELFDLAEAIPGPSTEALATVASRLSVTIVASLFERRAAGLYHNTIAVIDRQGKLSGTYRKMHIPDDPYYYEKFYFTPGDLGFRIFDTKSGRLGTLICWDQWFPEAARLTALQGADIIFYPTAIGWHPHEKDKYGAVQQEAWLTIQRSHAIANGIYVAAVNRIGQETSEQNAAGIEFWGTTFVADPFGIIIAQAATNKEEVVFAEIDPARIEEVRRNWPFLRDRRIDAYTGIDRRFLERE